MTTRLERSLGGWNVTAIYKNSRTHQVGCEPEKLLRGGNILDSP